MKKFLIVFILAAAVSTSCKKNNSGDDGSTVNGKVYSVGYLNRLGYFDLPRTAKLWVDAAETSLTNGTKDAMAICVFVSGADVYVAGYESNGSKTVAKLWKNGVAENLSDGTKNAEAVSVYVEGTDMYVAGSQVYQTVFRSFLFHQREL